MSSLLEAHAYFRARRITGDVGDVAYFRFERTIRDAEDVTNSSGSYRLGLRSHRAISRSGFWSRT